MTTDHPHLTEDERQRAADGTLADDERATIDAHLAACGTCTEDVARIASFMKHIRDPHPSARDDAAVSDLWPAIRARIETAKVVPLATPAPRRRGTTWMLAAAMTVAAAAIVLAINVRVHRLPTPGDGSFTIVDTAQSLTSVSDSAQAYERESQVLLDRLELRRAMLGPDARAALDHDLPVVDSAIAELKDAIARDPANPALRQLLAASYRQKLDLLRRAGNAS